jgi:hypothetical protein
MPSRNQLKISKLAKWILLGGIAIGFYKAASLPWYVVPIAILFYDLYLRLKGLDQTTKMLGRTGLPVAGVQRVVEMEIEVDDLFGNFALEKFSIPFPNSQREAMDFDDAREYNCSPRYVYYCNHEESYRKTLTA